MKALKEFIVRVYWTEQHGNEKVVTSCEIKFNHTIVLKLTYELDWMCATRADIQIVELGKFLERNMLVLPSGGNSD